MFAVIAALSERVVDLDRVTKGMIHKMDLEALAVKMQKCKELFYLLDDKEEGYVEMDTLMMEIKAGRINDVNNYFRCESAFHINFEFSHICNIQEHEQIILEKFGEDGQTWVDFMLYICYIPLFLEIHDEINGNPLNDVRNK